MAIKGVRRVRIINGRPDMWYKNLKGFLFDIDMHKYIYRVVNNDFNKKAYELVAQVDPELKGILHDDFFRPDQVYLLDVEFINGDPYCQDEYPYLQVFDEVALMRTDENKYRMPKALDGAIVTIAGFEGNGTPYCYTPKLVKNSYKEGTIGMRREIKLADIGGE